MIKITNSKPLSDFFPSLKKRIIDDWKSTLHPDVISVLIANVRFKRKVNYIKVIFEIGDNYQITIGFIKNGDDEKFKHGDLLRAKDAKIPYLEYSCGNIFDLDNAKHIHWTGFY